jgi:hypothetical protein
MPISTNGRMRPVIVGLFSAVLGLLGGALGLASLSAAADGVTDAVQDAMDYYKQGRLSAAAESLDFAAGLVRQKKAGEMTALLPKPLPGWNVDDSLSNLMAAAFFGGGISVQRAFKQGQKTILIRYLTDSAVLQSATLMFTDPSLASANGGKFEKLEGQKALVKYETKDQSGEIAVLINQRILVSIRGTRVPLTDLYVYARTVNFAGLSRLP